MNRITMAIAGLALAWTATLAGLGFTVHLDHDPAGLSVGTDTSYASVAVTWQSGR